MANPTVPQYVATAGLRSTFNPGPGLPTVPRTGVYVTDQSTLDAIIAAAATSNVQLVVSSTPSAGYGGLSSSYSPSATLADIQAALAAQSGLPSYVGARTDPYDAAGNVYGSSVRRQKIRAQLAKATSSLVQWVAVGDSKTAGYLIGAILAWPVQARAMFAALGIPIAGTGYVLCASGAADARWATTGTWVDSGYGYSQWTTAGATRTFTTDLPGTVVEVLDFDNSNYTISVNGASSGAGFLNVVGANAVQVGKRTLSGLTIAAGSTVTITATGTGGYIAAVCVRNTTGLNISNMGLVGAPSSSFTPTSFASVGSIITAIAPNVLSVELGTNDIDASVTLATFKANLATIFGNWSTAVGVLVASSHHNGPTLAAWETFVSAVYDEADTLRALAVDMTDRWGDSTNANALGFLGSDFKHETASGDNDKARAIIHAVA